MTCLDIASQFVARLRQLDQGVEAGQQFRGADALGDEVRGAAFLGAMRADSSSSPEIMMTGISRMRASFDSRMRCSRP
jgi:hypothetical protein